MNNWEVEDGVEVKIPSKQGRNIYEGRRWQSVRSWSQYLAVFVIFVGVQLSALLLAPILFDMQFQAFQDPQSPINPLFYVVLMVGMTAIMLLLLKYGGDWALRIIFLVAVFFTIYATLLPLVMTATSDAYLDEMIPSTTAFVLTFLLYKDPKWYTIDLVGYIVGVGAATILGISLGIFPALLLLAILAIYDAISVYKTKHMLALAEGATKLRLPILFVVPSERNFSMDRLDEIDLKDREKDGERAAMMMGVGDAVIPGILVVSVAVFLSTDGGSMLHYTFPALMTAGFTLVGALIGFALLMRAVSSGRPQAGLPFLNGGAIAGFLIGHLLFFGTLGL